MTSKYKDRRTPGVYITELAAFPPSVVGVQTAVPAFIGYTEKAQISGKPVFLKPVRVGSMADFEEIFGGPFEPKYAIKEVTGDDVTNNRYDFKVLASCTSPLASDCLSPNVMKYYQLSPTHTSRFNLYNSMRLFYANGGGNCWVVSVNDYEEAVKAAEVAIAVWAITNETRAFEGPNEPLITSPPAEGEEMSSRASVPLDTPGEPTTVSYADLSKGLKAIRDQHGPTMLVIPEAVLLPPTQAGTDTPWVSSDFNKLAVDMLTQCEELQDRVAILDVYGSEYATKDNLYDIADAFRVGVGGKFLNYGMAYFPFLNTTVVGPGEYDYTNIEGGTVPDESLATILKWQNYNINFDHTKPMTGGKTYEAVQEQISYMADPVSHDETVDSLNQNLVAYLPLLGDIERVMTVKNDVLPPSAAMAGVYTYTDAARGVWNAPANIALSSVDRSTFKLDDGQQADLNMPVSGKAINAIRDFVGRGTVVWGARTLDGNSNDYRYIQVRRTLIYVEQSIKAALNAFVFAPNDGNTWVTVTAMASNFLQDLWSRGGLMGAKASDAFDVQCGLGSTMTPTDVLTGYMIVQVRLQMIRPAEFIELTFKQKMQGIG